MAKKDQLPARLESFNTVWHLSPKWPNDLGLWAGVKVLFTEDHASCLKLNIFWR